MLKTRLISPYQHDGVRWLVKRENATDYPGGFLCDEMGLGKTVQMLATMCVNAHYRKTLVIVPKSIVAQWRDEINKFAPHFSVHVFDGPKRELANADITIAPYSVMSQRKGKGVCPLVTQRWDRVILDEGHEIRNQKSKTHIACRALVARVRWILSGTPVFNSMKDFVALCAFIGMSKLEVQCSYRDIQEKYVLRRTKSDVAQHNKRLELPPCDFDNVELEMYPEEKTLYDDVFRRGQEVITHALAAENRGAHQMMVLEALLRVRQVSTWPQLYLDGIALKEDTDPEPWTGRSRKMETLIDLVTSHRNEKSLIFAQFMGEMDRIQELLTERGIPVLRIDGSVLKDQREERIAAFKKAKTGAVFLIQIKAGGVGLNLQDATRVYITTPAWNPATELQAIGRAHRTGQTRKVVVRKLYYVGTETLPSVEQSIIQLQEHKSAICAQVLNDERLVKQIPVGKSKVTIQALAKIFRV
jgi:SNF2 family DNA or RNA helicase